MAEKTTKKDEFILSVYEWIRQPRNRCVEDYHYDCAEMMSAKDFRSEIREFLRQRFSQMYGTEPETRFLSGCTTRWIQIMFC